MRYLVISDIHNKIEKAQRIIDQADFDKIVFLGDYFDSLSDDPSIASDTAHWLKDSLQDPNHIHIIGNHDMPYLFPNNQYLWCPGWTLEKNEAINDILSHEDWNKMVPYHIVDNWILSHAGFSQGLFTHPVKGFDLEEACNTIRNDFKVNAPSMQKCKSFQYCSGRVTFSNVPVDQGGITWIDWSRLFVIDGYNQIVGHSAHDVPVTCEFCPNCTTSKNINIGLDTHLNHYIILDVDKEEQAAIYPVV